MSNSNTAAGLLYETDTRTFFRRWVSWLFIDREDVVVWKLAWVCAYVYWSRLYRRESGCLAHTC